MDLNRALRIMGYASAREFMDTAKDETKEPKKELDKKHFAQSMVLMKKKMKGQEVSLKSCIITNYVGSTASPRIVRIHIVRFGFIE